ncbi:MAG: OmpA family protein [Bryobacteraceae bacterium]|nr:OmpA family protein [Bryobacteraceae bacterium]
MAEPTDKPRTADQRLIEALSPTIQHALRRSLRDERRAWSEALYPIMLPSVRMAVWAAFHEAVESLNRLVEASLSWRSWQWRLEAWRRRKSFAEVVLLRTLVYRVEQVLLIHRETGLLLHSVASKDAATKDPDIISGMLTAVQDFVRDSFNGGQESPLNELRTADLTVRIEQGPWAVIAAVVRGYPPAELHATLTAAADLVHQEMAQELREFDGDAGRFVRARSILEGCLQAAYRTPPPSSYRKLWVLAAAASVLLVVGLAMFVQQRLRWSDLAARLNAEPGIVVTGHYDSGGKHVIEGLRDPLAADPAQFMADAGIDPARAALRLRPFVSLEPALQLARAREALSPPPGVALRLEADALSVEGAAPRAWIRRLREANLAALGIRALHLASLRDLDAETLRQAMESEAIRFEPGSSRLSPQQQQRAEKLAALLVDWAKAARELGRDPRVEVVGRADRSGDAAYNLRVSEERARRVRDLLAASGLPEEIIAINAEGDAAARGADNGEDAAYRTVRIRLSGDSAPSL